MPAVTVEDPLTLPPVGPIDPATPARPVVSVTTAPAGFEGVGFPVRRAFAGVDPRQLDPFVHMDQMGEVEYAPGEPKGTRLAPAPRLRDGHLHDRRDLPAPGLDRRRRPHHRRRHAVDDRGSGHPPHRGDHPRSSSRRRALPRHPAVGEPPGRREVGARPATRTSRPARSPCCARPTAARCVRVIAGEVAGTSGPGVTHTPIALAHASLRPGAELELPWPSEFNALVYVLAGDGTVGPEQRPVHDRPARGVRRRRPHRGRAPRPEQDPDTGPRGADPRWPADPRARRLVRPLRHEHPVPSSPRPSRTTRPAGWAGSPAPEPLGPADPGSTQRGGVAHDRRLHALRVVTRPLGGLLLAVRYVTIALPCCACEEGSAGRASWAGSRVS